MSSRVIPLLTFFILAFVAGCGSTSTITQSESSDPGLKKIDPETDYDRSLGTKSKTKQKIYKPLNRKPLEIPPDLITTTDPTVLENLDNFKENEMRILPEIVGARIVKKDGLSWLEIDTNVESAWKTITQFWSLSGIDLVEFNPEAGTMETEWIKEPQAYDEDESTIKSLAKEIFSSITNRRTSFDKYRIRFERISSDQSSMHVTHRWVARKAIDQIKKISEFEWVELPSDSNRVADFLQNIILIFDESAAT